jgi:hypothetical protein
VKFANATNLDRKSGVAQWRDLLSLFRRVISFPLNAFFYHPFSQLPRAFRNPPSTQLESH